MGGGERSARSEKSSTGRDAQSGVRANLQAQSKPGGDGWLSRAGKNDAEAGVGAQQGGPSGHFVVLACGQTLLVELHNATSVSDLQKVLQSKLQMELQTFQFFNAMGMVLSSDAHVRDAIAKGQTPLLATLTDTTIPFVEHRREEMAKEMAQMQFKLLMDQVAAATGKVDAVCKVVQQTQTDWEQFKQDSTHTIERIHRDCLQAVMSEREVARCESEQVSDRVDAVAAMVNSERQQRNVALQGMRSTLENERSMHEQELESFRCSAKDTKVQLECEKMSRGALECKFMSEMRTVAEKLEAFQKRVSEMLQDQQAAGLKSAEDWHNNFQEHIRHVNELGKGTESTAMEAQSQIAHMQQRFSALEDQMSDLSQKQAAGLAGMERLLERHDRISQTVDCLRFEEKQYQNQVQVALARLKELEVGLDQTDQLVQQERQGRADQLTCTKMVLTALEEKITHRLESEHREQDSAHGRRSPRSLSPFRLNSPMVLTTQQTQVFAEKCYSPRVIAPTPTSAGSSLIVSPSPTSLVSAPTPTSAGSSLIVSPSPASFVSAATGTSAGTSLVLSSPPTSAVMTPRAVMSANTSPTASMVPVIRPALPEGPRVPQSPRMSFRSTASESQRPLSPHPKSAVPDKPAALSPRLSIRSPPAMERRSPMRQTSK